MNFKEELKRYQNIVEKELNKYRRDKNCPEAMLKIKTNIDFINI